MPGIAGRTVALFLGALACSPARAADWTAEIGLVSDYRYRGLSLSDGRPAVQASLAAEHAYGAYAEIWASSATSGGRGLDEIDVTAGHVFDLTEAISIDLSATYYAYPGASSANALEIGGLLEASRGPLAATAGLSLAPPQRGTRNDSGSKKTNVYVFAGASYRLAKLPLRLRASLGFERGPWDAAGRGGKWDWSLGGEADFEQARIALDLVGSDAGGEAVVAALTLAF